MEQALRFYLSTGVALVGASVIAVTPVATSAAGIQQRVVELTSASDFLGDIENGAASAVGGFLANGMADLPSSAELSTFLSDSLTPYADLILDFVDNAVTIDGHWVITDPLPLLRQVFENWVGYSHIIVPAVENAGQRFATGADQLPGELHTMFTDLATGHTSAAAQASDAIVTSLVERPVAALGPVGEVGVEVGRHLGDAVNVLAYAAPYVASSFVDAFRNGVIAAEISAQGVYNDLSSGDPTAALATLVGAPGFVLDEALNETMYGGYGYEGETPYPGFFVPYPQDDGIYGVPYSGFDALLKELTQLVAWSIAPRGEGGGGGISSEVSVVDPSSAHTLGPSGVHLLDPASLDPAIVAEITHILDGLNLLNVLPDLASVVLSVF